MAQDSEQTGIPSSVMKRIARWTLELIRIVGGVPMGEDEDVASIMHNMHTAVETGFRDFWGMAFSEADPAMAQAVTAVQALLLMGITFEDDSGAE